MGSCPSPFSHGGDPTASSVPVGVDQSVGARPPATRDSPLLCSGAGLRALGPYRVNPFDTGLVTFGALKSEKGKKKNGREFQGFLSSLRESS